MKKLLKIALALVLVTAPVLVFAAHPLNFVQTPSISLYNSMSGSATSMRVTPYPKDLDGTKLTMSSFGTTPTLTVDPKVKNYEEIISFTGMTDNGDNTATLTGLSRDLLSQYPYTTTGTGRSHTAGATVVFSNNPQMYNRLAAWENDGTVTGNWNFTGQATFSTFPISATNGTSSINVAGVSQFATPAQQAAGTATSTNGTNAPLGLSSQYATSTWNSAALAANKTVIADGSGKIDTNFIATSTLFTATTSLSVGAFPVWQIGKQRQVFSSTGTSTFSVPAGITRVSVRLQAAGGGTTGNFGGNGGGGYAEKIVDVTGTTSIQVYVAPGAVSANGQWSTFGTNGFYFYATGGLTSNGSTNGALGGCGVNGDFNACGGAGGFTSATTPGVGGSSYMGGGGAGLSANCSSGVNYGGGGSGALSACGGDGGGQGIVIVEW